MALKKRELYFFSLLFFFNAHCMNLSEQNFRINEKLLHAAEQNVPFHLFKQLLEYGADPNALNTIGATPLHLVLQNKYINKHEVGSKVLLLLEKGARPDIQDSYGWTPFHLVANYGDLELCSELVESVRAIDWAFRAIKPALMANKRNESCDKPYLPKQILFLVFKKITHVDLTKPKQRDKYPNLYDSLKKERTECMIYNNISSKTAYTLACEKYEVAKSKNQESLLAELDKIKNLVNPESYK